MKEIKAYVRSKRAPTVLGALAEAGVVNVTLTPVLAVGPNVDPDETQVSFEFGRKANRMVKIELICMDRDEVNLVNVIRTTACTSQAGDGVITVGNVNRLVKIRTAAESIEAL